MGGLYDILQSYRQQNDPRFVYEGLFEEPAYTGPYIPGQEPPFAPRTFMDMTQRGAFGVPLQDTGINTIPMDLTQVGQFTDDAGIDIDESYEEFPEVKKERSPLDPRRIGSGIMSLLGFLVNPVGAALGTIGRGIGRGILGAIPQGGKDFFSDFKRSGTLKDFFQARRDRKAREEARQRGADKQRIEDLKDFNKNFKSYFSGDGGGNTGGGALGQQTGVADYRGDGEFFMSVKRFIPDFKYLRGNSIVTLFLNDYPDNTAVSSPLGPFTITSTTDKIDTRARGRLVAIQIANTSTGESWRYGTFRLDAQPDGRR